MNELYLGEYYVKEIKPSLGYNLDTTEYDFSLDYEGQEVTIVTKNVEVKERVISQPFQIIKVSVEGSTEAQLLKGAEFTIKAQKDIEKYIEKIVDISNRFEIDENDVIEMFKILYREEL